MVLDTPPHFGALPPAASTGPLLDEQATSLFGELAIGPAAQHPAGLVLWLVRHGESTWNGLGLAQGHSDQPRLTPPRRPPGPLRRRPVASRPIGAVYASDLQRAVATAAPLAAALRLDVTRDPRLRERCLGLLEGTPPSMSRPRSAAWPASRVIDPDARPPDGESLRDLYWRVAGFADDLLRRAAGAPGRSRSSRTAHAAGPDRLPARGPGRADDLGADRQRMHRAAPAARRRLPMKGTTMNPPHCNCPPGR